MNVICLRPHQPRRMVIPHNTGRVQIGIAYTRPPMRLQGDAFLIQQALLDARTAQPLTLRQRVFGYVWRWL